MPLRPLPRLGVPWPSLLLFNLVVLPTALLGIHGPDTDVFYRLASGRYMVEHGTILDHEAFSFTIPGRPWANYAWLFEYALYRLYALGGFPALIAFRAAVVLLTANLLLAWCHRHARGSPLAAFAVGLLAFALYSVRATSIRPHLVSYLFLVVAMLLLDRLWARPGRVEPWVPLLGVLWSNSHGVEYPVLLAVVGLHGVAAVLPRMGEDWRALACDRGLWRWPVLLLGCAAAFAVNPFGPRLLGTALMGLDAEVTRYIQEFRPYAWWSVFNLYPTLDLASAAPVSYMVVLAAVAFPDWLHRRDWRAVLLVLVGGGLAAYRLRFIPEFALVAAGFVAEGLSGLPARLGRRPWWVTAVLAAVVGYVVLAAGGTARAALARGHFAPVSATAYPIGPTELIRRAGLGGNVFSNADVAGYVEWAVGPRVRVFMDMRTPEPFDGQLFWLYREVAFGSDPERLEALQARWPIDWVLLRRDTGLARALARPAEQGFALVWADDGFVLFAHPRVLGAAGQPLVLRVLDPFDPSLGYVAGLTEPARAALRGEVQRLLAVWPENHLARRTGLALLLAEGQYAPAYVEARRLAVEFPHEAPYPYVAGLALRGLGRDAAALDPLERAVGLDPELWPAYPAAAEAALGAGRPEAGRALMARYRLLRRDRLSAVEWALLGDLDYRAGAIGLAVRAYERALWLAPGAGPLRARIENNLGSAHVDAGAPARGLTHLEAALGLLRPFPEAEFNRARAWTRLGRGAEAQAAFGRLAEDVAAPPEIRARARAALGR